MSDQKLIQPRTLKGFRDFLPEAMMPRERLSERVSQVYRSYGFAPIDTPVLEYLDILLGKGSDETDKQLYRFTDHGGREVGMRFDLTIPFARFAAQHLAIIGTPFKRYHLAKVWRGENTQAGRYREFMQCDFDTIGTTSVVSDIETAMVINDIMEKVDLISDNTFTGFKIHLNSRAILSGLLEKFDLLDRSAVVLRAIDKLAKIGPAKVLEEMTASGVAAEQGEAILSMLDVGNSDHDAIFSRLDSILTGNERGLEGVAVLAELIKTVHVAGIDKERFVIDLTIARGLDYYTGIIYETFLNQLPQLGSVCSGGRYDNLAQLYTKQSLPGVGASLGLDRLLTGLEEIGLLPRRASPVNVMIALLQADQSVEYQRLARMLRQAGIGVELYPQQKKLGVQIKYADSKGMTFVLVMGTDEIERQVVGVKNIKTSQQVEIPIDEVVSFLLTAGGIQERGA